MSIMACRTLLAICLLTFLGTAGSARQSEASPGKWRGLLVGERAYLLGDADQAVGPGARMLGVAPKGRYILSERRKPTEAVSTSGQPSLPTEVTLNLWDTKTRKASVLWRFQETAERQISNLRLLSWLSPNTALVELGEVHIGADRKLYIKPTLLVVYCGIHSTQAMPLLPLLGTAGIYRNPTQPLTLLHRLSSFGPILIELVLIDTSGKQKSILSRGDAEGWSADGARFYLSRYDEKSENNKSWSAVDLNLNVTPLDKEPEDITPKSEPANVTSLPLKAVEQNATLTVKTTSEKLPSLWLLGETGAELRVAAEIDEATSVLLPDLSAVAYRHQNALYVAPLTSITKTLYTELEKRALRLKVISEARQIGEAFMLYAQKHSETYPDANGNLAQDIGSYLKDADVLKRFRYTHTGPFSLPEIAEPANCVLGHLPGSGGRVLLFADGHVRWEDSEKIAP